MTAVAVVVFLGTKFVEGAWSVVITVPLLMLMFTRIESYYADVARELKLGRTPPPPCKTDSIVVIPIEVLLDPHRSLIRTVLRYIRSIEGEGGGAGGLEWRVAFVVPAPSVPIPPAIHGRRATPSRRHAPSR